MRPDEGETERSYLVAAQDAAGGWVAFASARVDRAEAEHDRMALQYPVVRKAWLQEGSAIAAPALSEQADQTEFRLLGEDSDGNAWYVQTGDLERLYEQYRRLKPFCLHMRGNRLFEAVRSLLDQKYDDDGPNLGDVLL